MKIFTNEFEEVLAKVIGCRLGDWIGCPGLWHSRRLGTGVDLVKIDLNHNIELLLGS